MLPAIVGEQVANLIVVGALVGVLTYMVIHLRNLFSQEEGEEGSDNNDNGDQQ